MYCSIFCFTFVNEMKNAPFRALNHLISKMTDRIRQIMEAQHMTQQVFATYIGTTPATLSGIFNGRTRPTINIIESIKKAFPNISLEWLMFGQGEMYQLAAAVDDQNADALSSDSQSSSIAQAALIFADAPSGSSPTPSSGAGSNAHLNSVRNTRSENVREEVKILDKPQRHVTEIRVYYDDQTWESFVPSKK